MTPKIGCYFHQRSRAGTSPDAWTAGLPGPTPGDRQSGLDLCRAKRRTSLPEFRPGRQPRVRSATAELLDQPADA
jgi:hypothetical protein